MAANFIINHSRWRRTGAQIRAGRSSAKGAGVLAGISKKEGELSRFLAARSDGQADIRRACGVTQLGTAQGHGEIDDAIHARPL